MNFNKAITWSGKIYKILQKLNLDGFISLDAFIEKYHSRILSNYVIYTKDTKKENNIQYLPVYMVPFL